MSWYKLFGKNPEILTKDQTRSLEDFFENVDKDTATTNVTGPYTIKDKPRKFMYYGSDADKYPNVSLTDDSERFPYEACSKQKSNEECGKVAGCGWMGPKGGEKSCYQKTYDLDGLEVYQGWDDPFDTRWTKKGPAATTVTTTSTTAGAPGYQGNCGNYTSEEACMLADPTCEWENKQCMSTHQVPKPNAYGNYIGLPRQCTHRTKDQCSDDPLCNWYKNKGCIRKNGVLAAARPHLPGCPAGALPGTQCYCHHVTSKRRSKSRSRSRSRSGRKSTRRKSTQKKRRRSSAKRCH